MTELARCIVRGCPFRLPPGRPCPDHDEDRNAIADAAAELGIDLAPPGRRDEPAGK